MAFPRLRYSKAALLTFGAGLLLGLAVVSARLDGLARIASGAMALGIAALPFTAIADWRRKTPAAAPARKRRRATKPPRRKTAATRSRTRQKR
jgi:hypothetical protein